MPIATTVEYTQVSSSRGSVHSRNDSFQIKTVPSRRNTGASEAVDWTPVMAAHSGSNSAPDGLKALREDGAVRTSTQTPVIESAPDSEHKLIIGVDFGTTYSGYVAYCRNS